jgi:hypothetical protein
MPTPPPVPWFRGRTVVVTEIAGMLRFKALGKHRFVEPEKGAELVVPIDTLVIAVAEGPALGFQGDFAAIGRGDEIVLAPLDPDDAQAIEHELELRLDLPRTPRRMSRTDVTSVETWEFVSLEGELGFVTPEGFRALKP